MRARGRYTAQKASAPGGPRCRSEKDERKSDSNVTAAAAAATVNVTAAMVKVI